MRQTVFITGGSRGIGAACVRAFAAAGWSVAFTYRENRALAGSLAEQTGALALCADLYNPKVVQATMGALARVRVHYVDLVEFLPRIGTPIYGTFLDGQDIYGQSLTPTGIIVMGNEGNGISPEVRKLVTHSLFLPSYPPGRVTSESLNVAIATAVVCAEFRRR